MRRNSRALLTLHTNPKTKEGESWNRAFWLFPHHHLLRHWIQEHEQMKILKCLHQLFTQTEHTIWHGIFKPNWHWIDPNHQKLSKFLIPHLKYPLKDKLVLLTRHHKFVMELGGERVIGNIKKLFKLITKVKNLQLHLKGTLIPCLYQAGCGERLHFSHMSHQRSKKLDLETWTSLQPWEAQS